MQAKQRYQVRRTMLADKDIKPEIKVASTILIDAMNWKRNQYTLKVNTGPDVWVKNLSGVYGVPVEDLEEAFALLLQKGWVKLVVREDGNVAFVLGELPNGFPSHDFEQV